MKSVFKIGCGIALGVAIVVIAIVVVVSLALSNGGNNNKVTQVPNSGSGGGSSTGSNSGSGGNTFVLKVIGHHTHKASVTYSDPNVNMSQDNNAKLPWEKTFKTNADTSIIGFSVEAQNQSGHGSLTCEIIKNGQVVGKNTSHGAYAVVTCSPSNQ